MARLDSFGMFWEDVQRDTKSGEITRMMPPIPATGWKCLQPCDFPNLEAAAALAIDTETYDPELLTKGAGWGRGVGHIVGVSVAAVDNLGNIDKWYFPIRHEVNPSENLDPDTVFSYLRKELGRANQPKVGANIIYDIGWLEQEGVQVKGDLHDVQFAEALLTENQSVALDVIARKYLNTGKITEQLYEWCSAYYGGVANGTQRKNIYRTPPSLAGEYAEADAELPIRLMDGLYKLLDTEGLTEVYQMECKLMRLTIAMRMKGIRVDVDKAERTRDELYVAEKELQKKLDLIAGWNINIGSAPQLAKLFKKKGVDFPRNKPTAKMIEQGITEGNPSFAKDVLVGMDNEYSRLILDIRKLAKLRGTFVEGYILDSHVDGRVYAQFHALRGEAGGTRSGRWSSSNPNLQNIPSRDKVWAPVLRGLFVPDHGHECIFAPDYSQIEYRFLAHYARGAAGRKLRGKYRADPNIDYHNATQAMLELVIGRKLDRKPVKTINFGLIYGMGKGSLMAALGLGTKLGNELFAAYHKAAPYAKETMDYYSDKAETDGYVSTILGRKSRFALWEPNQWGGNAVPLSEARARKAYGNNIKRASTFKALNRVLQGSAAEAMKKGMLDCYEAGLMDGDNVARLTVHDEMVFSKEKATLSDEWSLEVKRLMENVLPQLRVPLRVDMDLGEDWGHVG